MAAAPKAFGAACFPGAHTPLACRFRPLSKTASPQNWMSGCQPESAAGCQPGESGKALRIEMYGVVSDGTACLPRKVVLQHRRADSRLRRINRKPIGAFRHVVAP